MPMLAGELWNLLLGRSDSRDASLEAKLNATKAESMVEHDCHEEATFEGRFFSLGLGEVVTKLINFFDEV